MSEHISRLVAALSEAREIERVAEREFLASFGRELRRRREELGLSQAQFAAMLGLTRTSVTNMEAGKQDTTVGRLMVLAAALGCQPTDLLPRFEEVRRP